LAKAKVQTCYCPAYPFPHRWKSGRCVKRKPVKKTAKTYKAMSRRNAKAKAKAR